MRKNLLALFVLMPLAACVSQEQITTMNAKAAPPSAATKQAVVQGARNYLKDPYSIRDAEISGEIVLDAASRTTAVCVRYNSKNGFGGYVGRGTTSVRLVNSIAVAAYENQASCNHPALRYYPFPEIKQLASL